MAQKKQIKIVFMAKNFREEEENIIEENITVLMRHFKSRQWVLDRPGLQIKDKVAAAVGLHEEPR